MSEDLREPKETRQGWPSRWFSSPGMKLVASFTLLFFLFAGLFISLNWLGVFIKPVYAKEISITAISGDRAGTDLNSAFLLKSLEPLDERTVKAALTIIPELEYKLEKAQGGREYTIIPLETLQSHTLYRFAFDPTGANREDLTWAFQTKSVFRVVRTLPGNQSTYVPVNTGIEIMLSHEGFDLEAAKNNFSISPQTEGRFEQNKKALVFIPKALAQGTIYTVTLKQGTPLKGSQEVLEQDYSFSFETQPVKDSDRDSSFELDSGTFEFSTTEAPVFSTYFYVGNKSHPTTQSPLNVSLYRYADRGAFREALVKKDALPQWSNLALRNYQEDLSALPKVAEFSTEFLSVDDYQHYVVFPQALAAGYYAAEIQTEKASRQVWFQVSDLAVYQALGEENSLFWVNDLQTKAPVREAKLVLESRNESYHADPDGVVLVNQSLTAPKPDYALVQAGTQELLVPLEGVDPLNQWGWLEGRAYWRYLYLDRELYRPQDTVHFWGVVAPRTKEAQTPKQITVALRGHEGPFYEGGEDTALLSKTLPLEGQVFSGELALPVLKPGYYTLEVKLGDAKLLSRGFSVETYEKPAFRLSVVPQHQAILVGAQTNFVAKAAFFEGTAAPGLKLNYTIRGNNGQVTTGPAGTADIPYTGQKGSYDYSQVHYEYLGLNATLPETGEISGASGVYVFESQYYIKGEAVRSGAQLKVKAQLSTVDLSRINAGADFKEENFLAGPASNSLVKGTLYEEVWKKVEAGQYYDYINKRVENRYYYEYATKPVANFNLVTDGKGEATYSSALEKGKTYYVELAAQDALGREVKRRLHIFGDTAGDVGGYQNYYLLLDQEEKGYTPGQKVNAVLMESRRELTARDKGYLFFTAQKKIGVYQVGDSSQYTYTYQEADIPGLSLFGVYFNGNAYQEAPYCMVPFAKDSKGLKIEVQTDKNSYQPGELVKLKVSVKDRNDKAVRAHININLVDEALYSLRAQNVNFLSELYSHPIYPLIMTRVSHLRPGPGGGGAEKGGEGDGERKDFQDTVLFTSLETDRNGRASTEFKLPDNLTSWRITTHALSEGLQAGSGSSQLPVKLPFFVEVIYNSLALVTDQPVVQVKAYGEKLNAASTVNYRFKLTTPEGQELTSTAQGKAFQATDWKLPALKAGRYSLTVEGSGEGLKDSLSKDLTVADSYLERTVTQQLLLSESTSFEATSKQPLTLVFSDYEKSQYLAGLYRLAYGSGGRMEMALAAWQAQTLLQQYFPEEVIAPVADQQTEFLKYQQPDGGISILPYGESDLVSTTLAASCAPRTFDERAMAAYLYRVLEGEGKEDNITLALWGLAALGEPVLLQIEQEMANPKLTPAEKINLAMAHLDIGNGAYARTVYQELLKPWVEDLGTTMRVKAKAGRDQDEILEATTQMAMLAARLNQAEKNKLYQYLLENQATYTLNLLEQGQILKYNLHYMNPEPVSWTYELRGEAQSKTLKANEVWRVMLLPEDLAGLKFKGIQGKVGVIAVSNQAYEPAESNAQAGLAINRTYLVNGMKVGSLGRSDLVQVVINYEVGNQAPDGYYEVIDVLPAGLRYVNRPYNYQQQSTWNRWYPSEVKGQKLVFTMDKGKGKITYYARVVSAGDFLAEPPLLSHTRNQQINVLGSRERLVIK